MEPIMYRWPNGRTSIAGGTRTEVNLNRPWQKEMSKDSSTCPFCTKPQDEVKAFSEAGGWRLLNNKFTPFPLHRLLIPATCWSVEESRALGGEEKISAALDILMGEMQKASDRQYTINIHVGYSAGQNVSHLHWHLLEYPFAAGPDSVADGMEKAFQENRGLVLSDTPEILIGVGGIRAGQCFLMPKGSFSTAGFSKELYGVVRTYEKAFTSTQGLPPDYSIFLFFKKGNFEYATYTPILNNLGALDLASFYHPDWPVTMPWPHEVTVSHLKMNLE